MELARLIWNAILNLLNAGSIKESGLFQADPYRLLYLRNSQFRFFPLFHYLLIGEWSGCRPNAFFDPAFFNSTAGTKQLWKYLKKKKLWKQKTSSSFDGAFYCAKVGAARSCSIAPLVDFWHHGFDRGVGCSDSFDMSFFQTATTRDRGDKKAIAFSAFTSPENFIFSAEDLQRRQDNFYKHIDLKVLKEHNTPRRRNLVFVQAAAAYDIAFVASSRQFDILLNYYEPIAEPAGFCEVALCQKGTKVTAIRKILDQRPDLLLPYDHVLFLDDDVAITAEAIERFFDVMEREGLDLAQPSLTSESTTYFADLKQPHIGPGVRKATTVEIMMPGLSRRALARCGWVFSAGISGWAVDFLLGAAIQKAFGSSPAVIGACVAEHLRPFDTENGTFYRFLRSHGIDARVEAGAIALKYGVDDSSKAISLVD